MLSGSLTAKIDEKSRLRLPAKFRQELPETVDNKYYVTSDDGQRAQVYPIPIWERILEKLMEAPRMSPAKKKLRMITSYYGAEVDMDPQGRILIPPIIREKAQLSGDVRVVWEKDHLEVWNEHIFGDVVEKNPLTEVDWENLYDEGIYS